MLTHDIEPVIDTTKVLRKSFRQFSTAHFLKNKNGILGEREIRADNMLSYTQICHKVLASPRPQIIKLIYLRRYFEIIDDSGDAYEVLSNLLHRRLIPEDHRLPPQDEASVTLDNEAFQSGIEEIKKMINIPDFNYELEVLKLRDETVLRVLYENAQNGYEKLMIFRLIDEKHKNSVIRKYINETYHIENDFICQLDPSEFDPIPQYVIDECDKVVAEVGAN
ncbi:MAG: hypothetical protein CJBNEKGG_01473 [Prosthecobacter sp.]|nr:hypothetical protein [Prosthecobacter sp.]